jgi:hypothetical protein
MVCFKVLWWQRETEKNLETHISVSIFWTPWAWLPQEVYYFKHIMYHTKQQHSWGVFRVRARLTWQQNEWQEFEKRFGTWQMSTSVLFLYEFFQCLYNLLFGYHPMHISSIEITDMLLACISVCNCCSLILNEFCSYYILESWSSLVSIVTRLWAGWQGFDFCQGQGLCLSAATSTSAMGLTHPPVQGVPVTISWGVK